MPTNRRLRTFKRAQAGGTWHRAHLETGARAGESTLEALQLWSDYLHGGRKLERIWQGLRDQVLADWTRQQPGTRPWAWWLFDAPRPSTPARELPTWARAREIEPRELVAGRGVPLSTFRPHLVPRYRLGAPIDWTEVDPLDPPRIESQAAYLRRHGRLTPGEERRLTPEAFAPEFAVVAPESRVDRYARDVRAGRIIAGPLVRLACDRHLRDRERVTAGAAGEPLAFWFDEETAALWWDFFELVLRLADTEDEQGDALPFILQPWQAFIVGSLFGWRDRDGYRRFRECYIETGKGSGKTPLFAGIGVGLVVIDNEPAAEVYSAATTIDQARIMWRDAQRMVDCSPALKTLLTQSMNALGYPATHSVFRPVSAEHKGLDGKRPHGGLSDEVHEHTSGIVVNKIRAGAKRRRQPFFGEITNAGFDRTSICFQHHEHSRKILEGLVPDERWFAYVCALDKDDDPLRDRTCWIKTNPNLGVTPTVEYLERQVQNARNIPAELNIVLRLNFCVWTQAVTRWLDPGQWAACATEVPASDLLGVACYGGLDLGQTDDLSAFARVWPLDDGRVVVRMRYWLPRAALEKYRDRPYDEWRRSGLLTVTDGNTTDYDRIEDEVEELARSSGVRELAYDKMFAEQLAQHLQGAGLVCVDQRQAFHLNEALRKLSSLVQDGRLCHGGDPILAWMADNAVVREGRNREIRLDKERSGEKIDGIAALAMALARHVVHVTAREPDYQMIVYGGK